MAFTNDFQDLPQAGQIAQVQAVARERVHEIANGGAR
jgi:hypothetical protein